MFTHRTFATLLVLLALSASTACASPSGPDPVRDGGPTDGGDGGPHAGDAGPDAGPDGGLDCAWVGDSQFGSANEDAVLALRSYQSGLVVAGFAEGTYGEQNIEPSGRAHGFVRALAASGAVQWESVFDSGATDTIEALDVDARGRILAAGRTTGAFAGSTNRGQQDAFVALLEPGAGPPTIVQFGDERPQHPRAIAWGRNGTAVVGGFDDTYVPSNFVEDWDNPFFAVLGGLDTGTPTQSFHPERTVVPDVVGGLALDPQGDDLFLSIAAAGGPGKGLSVRRQGRDGSVRWSTRLSTLGLEAPGPVLASSDGTIWVADTWVRSSPNSDLALFQLDGATGAVLHAFDFPTADAAEEVNGLVRDAHGDFWLAGSTSGQSHAGALGTRYAGGLDALVLHVSPQGDLLDSWQAGTAGDDEGRAIAIDACGHVVLGGSTTGALVPGAAPLGKSDAFVLRLPLAVRKQ